MGFYGGEESEEVVFCLGDGGVWFFEFEKVGVVIDGKDGVECVCRCVVGSVCEID